MFVCSSLAFSIIQPFGDALCRVFSLVLLKKLCYEQWILLAKLLAFDLLHLAKAKFACYFRHLLSSYFCIPVPYNENDIFWGVSSRRSCRSSQKRSTSASLALLLGHRFGLWWYYMVSLGNEQRSFSLLRLHPSNVFWMLLLIVMATEFLLRNSCPQ